MGIQVTNADSIPAIAYDRIHLTSLEIIQKVFTDDTAIPKYVVKIMYRYFGVYNGKRYYKEEDVHTLIVEDFVTEAMTYAAAGNTTLVSALTCIEGAIAFLISEKVGNPATVI